MKEHVYTLTMDDCQKSADGKGFVYPFIFGAETKVTVLRNRQETCANKAVTNVPMFKVKHSLFQHLRKAHRRAIAEFPTSEDIHYFIVKCHKKGVTRVGAVVTEKRSGL